MSGRNYEDGLFLGSVGDPNLVNDTTPFAAGQLGKIVNAVFKTKVVNTVTADFDNTPQPRAIQYVQRVTNTTESNNPVVGDVAYWNNTASYKVCSNTGNAIGQTQGPRVVAGVFLGDASQTTKCVSAGNYGFIQVAGVAPVRVTGSVAATTIGYPLIESTYEGKVEVRQGISGTTQASFNDTQAAQMLVGYALTSTTVTDGTGFVQCILALPQIR